MTREIFSWKGLMNDVLKYVNECPTFQQNKVEHTHRAGLLHPLPIPEQKWESISMDFITGFYFNILYSLEGNNVFVLCQKLSTILCKRVIHLTHSYMVVYLLV